MDARTRLGWIRPYQENGTAGVVCRRCGISRPTLRKWWRRCRAEGVAGLETRSRRPHRSPNRKVFAEQEELIRRLRCERKLGIKRLGNELARRHGLRPARDTLHKVLRRHGENRLKRPRLKRRGTKRRSRPVPGDRVQMDACKIRPGLHQYTAIDDCSRRQVLGLDPRRHAAGTLDVLDRVAAGMPFPVRRIQTDRGGEFFACEVQDRLRDRRITFRPVGSGAPNPRAPHLNGPPAPAGAVRSADRIAPGSCRPMVERVQRTALEEFWPTVDPRDPALAARLDAWRGFYNRERPHSALGGGTPAERIAALTAKIPPPEAVHAACDPSREFIRSQNTRYRWLPTSTRVT